GRRAANTFEACFFVVSPSDYDALLAEIDRSGGPTAAFRLELARKAFAHTGGYDTAIAATPANGSCAAATAPTHRRSRSHCARSATCVTARTRTRMPRGTPTASPRSVARSCS